MDKTGEALFPLFLKLAGRSVLLVGGGPVATAKAAALAEARARVTVVSPALTAALTALTVSEGWKVEERGFQEGDLDGAWLVVAAAPPAVNAAVAAAAEARHTFVVAVDDPPSATAYGAGIIRRAGITVAISTAGQAPALAGLLREGLDAMLPADLDGWLAEAQRLRPIWRAAGTPMGERRPQLLQALNRLYEEKRGPGGLGAGWQPTPLAPESAAPESAAEESGATESAAPEGAEPAVTESVAAAGTAGGGVPRGTDGSNGGGGGQGSGDRRASGRVTLVGAGPGEPDLLTIRGARRLAEADLVLYDALSSDGMRAYAPRARWFYVGKRACRQSIGQDVLNRLMIKEARRGHHVVRLKCGDPFVFGRGGEEMWALAEAGIACEVVPGVSSSVAGPALAGIPVTHRGAASAFTVIAGHHPGIYRPMLEALPKEGMTVVVLMGLAERATIADTLRACGWAASTPAAIVVGAATAAAWRWMGTLDQLGAAALPARSPGDPGAPGLLVIGQVVATAAAIEAMKSDRDLVPRDVRSPNEGKG